MSRQVRYLAVAETLRDEIRSGTVARGAILPSEAELAARHDVSRVTVRKALDLLRDEGLVDSRQGFGWFVSVDPYRQPLGRLSTLEADLAAAGVVAERRVVGFTFTKPSAHVRDVLSVDAVLEVRRLNLADGEPFARVTVWVPDHLAGDLSRSDVERETFYDLLPVRLGGAVQTIGATAASEGDATLLGVPVGSALLECERTTRDTDGRSVLLSNSVFHPLRAGLVVELVGADPSADAAGVTLRDS